MIICFVQITFSFFFCFCLFVQTTFGLAYSNYLYFGFFRFCFCLFSSGYLSSDFFVVLPISSDHFHFSFFRLPLYGLFRCWCWTHWSTGQVWWMSWTLLSDCQHGMNMAFQSWGTRQEYSLVPQLHRFAKSKTFCLVSVGWWWWWWVGGGSLCM